MARQTITRQQLYRIEKDFINTRLNNPGLALLLQPKIQRFESVNRMQLEVMHSRFIDIQNKYVKKDAHGNFMQVVKDGTAVWDFVEHFPDIMSGRELWDEEVAQAFENECNQFFSQTITIEA